MRNINSINLTILFLFQANLFFSCSPSKSHSLEIRLAPEEIRTSAAYGRIQIDFEGAWTVSKIECDAYESVEWHESKIDENGVMRMKRLPFPISLQGRKEYQFLQGRDHLMLFGRKRRLIQGEQLLLTFSSPNHAPIPFYAKVIK